MTLHSEHITNDDFNLPIIHQLYENAFPHDEKAPFDHLLKQANQANVHFLAYYHLNQFCGFTYLITNQQTVYIFYLAVLEEKRNQGIGGEILEDIKERFFNCTLFLDIEVLNPQTSNYKQRKQRKEFYLKHGFESSSYGYHFYHVDYEVLKYGSHFHITDCHDLFYQFSHGRVDVEFKKIRHQ